MLRTNIRKKQSPKSIELCCEFSECTDKCTGMEALGHHVSLHLSIMKDQLSRNVAIDSEDSDDVDLTKCECPWRGCEVILTVSSDWEHCTRHIYFHAFHSYLKALGDDGLRCRDISLECQREENQRNIIPELPDPFICKWNDCKYRVDKPWLYYQHVNSHAVYPLSDEAQQRKCFWDSCKYACPAYANVTKLKDHLRTHTQERRCACSRCGALYCSMVRLADHQEREGRGEKSFQCSHCSKKCASERILRDHLRKHVNMYGCMFCDMTCPSPSALRIHILYRHSTERPFSCSQCDKKFKTKFDLSSHKLTHDYQNTEFFCSFESCLFACRSIIGLHKHINEVHKDSRCRIFGCHVCDELFTTSASLSRHLKSKHHIKYPSGHVKFRFAKEADGIRRLVTVRYECFREDNEDCSIEEGDEDTSIVSAEDGPSTSTELQMS